MNTTLEKGLSLHNFEQYEVSAAEPSPEAMAGAGFSDWRRIAHRMGYDALAATIEQMDPSERMMGDNPHCTTAERLALLELPSQAYVAPTVAEFLVDPERYFAKLHEGDYYFLSIIPGVHLAHESSPAHIVEFVHAFVATHPQPAALSQRIYLSHNGEAIMSAHIIARADEPPNTLYAECTVGNFNAFHRGAHAPELIAARHYQHRFSWDFRDSLSEPRDWRDTTHFMGNYGVRLTRMDIVHHLQDAIACIPHDQDYTLPGYYEVLFERGPDNTLNPAFIEAVIER